MNKYIKRVRLPAFSHGNPVYIDMVLEGHPNIGQYVVVPTKIMTYFKANKMGISFNKMAADRGDDPELYKVLIVLGGAVLVRKLLVGDNAEWIDADLLKTQEKGGEPVGEEEKS